MKAWMHSSPKMRPFMTLDRGVHILPTDLTGRSLMAKIFVIAVLCLSVVKAGWAQSNGLASSDDVLREDVVQESTVFFSAGGIGLDTAARAQISTLGQVLSNPVFANTCLRLVGHSDTSGSATANLELSLARASVVAEALAQELYGGIVIEFVVGRGEDTPLSLFPPQDPRQRRVTIEARTCPET